MKKQILVSTILGTLLFALSGCGGGNANSNSDVNQNEVTDISPMVNHTPKATFKTFSINRDVTYNGQLTATDQDEDRVKFVLTSNPKHGTVSIDKNGCFVYTPETNYRGKDSFSYKVEDDMSSCPTQVVDIDITEKTVAIPNPPSDIKLESMGTSKIKVSWSDNSENETGFEIYRDGTLVSVVNKNSTFEQMCDGLKPATTYNIEVKAKNEAGSSESVSGTITTKDITTTPKAPTGLKVLAKDKTSIRLSWIDNADNESSYEIYQDGKLIRELTNNCQCIVVRELKEGTTYKFNVVAKNKIGTSSSETITVTTDAIPIIVDDAPIITINGASKTLIIGDTYTDEGATATDKEDGVVLVTATSNVNTAKAGDYVVTYTAKDKAGHVVIATRVVKVLKASTLETKKLIPIDSNIELGNEDGILYYVDPRPEENGLNRALRIDYLTMTYTDLDVAGINPHSIDRAGDSNKFYIRTQNSKSFDVINFVDNSVKTVSLGDHKPRAIGAINLKYNLQLLSVKNYPAIDIIDTTTDTVIKTVGDSTNLAPFTATGHALWFDTEHFGLIDRINKVVKVFKVIDTGGVLSFVQTSSFSTKTSTHALERVQNPLTRDDLVTFYALNEGDVANGIAPIVSKLKFDPATGSLTLKKEVSLDQSIAKVHYIPPITHHAGVSPDGKYFYVPVLDGKVYIIDIATMQVIKIVDAKLGAAHVEFSSQEGLAIITNHYSTIVTIIDLATQTVKANIDIGVGAEFHEYEKHLLQPHFSYISKDGKYYYTFSSQDGDFVKINLKTLQVEDRLHTGGAPEQAHS